MIAAICPTRSRPGPLKKTIETFLQTSDSAHFIAWVDEDQKDLYRFDHERVRIHVGSRMGPVRSTNLIADLYGQNYDVLGMVPDDCAFKVPGWDRYLEQTIQGFPNRIGMVSAAHNNGPFVNFPWVTQQWFNLVGWYFYPTNFHYCCDTVLEILGECANAIVYAPADRFLIEHLSEGFTNQEKFEPDALAFLNWCIHERRDLVRRVREAKDGPHLEKELPLR